ncbi:hypothetical protein KC878_03760, partial [Candidatus Saccharibacteria bacterium]|nr:hypothetical protein [Candidatus Saccharibacteria bacterium]
MSNKQLLDQIQTSLKAGEITADELKALLKKTDKQTQVELQPGKHIHFSATSVLYYIGGLIMFGAQVALLVQSWDTLGSFGRIVMTLVIGLMVWAFSVLLNKNQTYGPRYKEVADAVMLTGSLGVSTGVFVTINEIAQKVGNTVGPWHIVYGLCVIAIAHWLLDAIVRKDLSILFAMLATAASITAFLFAVLQDVVSDTPEYGALSFVAGALVFAGLATAVAKDNLRAHLKYPVWSVSAFVVFAAIFGLASGGNLKVL